ncbi:hypothetical protein MNV49_001153 [Pseudohyphozyma bogoriensis]|nr:hypothetical protein MNV49_001153 [Pseudohyphozyma bogoriensis]
MAILRKLTDDGTAKGHEQFEHADPESGKAVLPAGKAHQFDKMAEQRVEVTEEDSKRICRKTDLHVLSFVSFIYFLQILDKTIIGYAAVFGLKTDANLVGDQYSTIGAMGYYAQLAAQPLAAFLLVKLPVKRTLPTVVFLWGASCCAMGACTNFTGIAASRFFLGWFEAMCVPIFSLITIAWYRRSEQPMRVACWYGTNGLANIIGSPLSYGIGKITGGKLYSYQILFILCGGITVLSGVAGFFIMDNSVAEARFLNEEDRLKGVERLRANNTGIAGDKFKWSQIFELVLEPKTYLFAAITICLNVGANVSSTFGPLLLEDLVGFDAATSTLLNMPYGALQCIVILLAAWLAYQFKNKSGFLIAFIIPVIWGTAILYAVPRSSSNEGALLFGYYSLSFLFAGNPLIISWIMANTAGTSKKTGMMCLYNAASSAGNIIGPYLFTENTAPSYLPGLRATMGIFVALLGLIVLQMLNIIYLNKRKEQQRVRNGKPAKITDYSMSKKYEAQVEDILGVDAFVDATDQELDEFIYLL